jgi:hypothetical protein
MLKKKITFFNHPGESHEDQIRMALDWSPLQILQYHEAYKAWRTKAFGETEAQKLTKGKKVVIWDPEAYFREPREYIEKKHESKQSLGEE